MPAVLVHGVPETPAVWKPLAGALGRSDIVTPRVPGFGCARPPGFSSTKEEYLDWLIAELEGIDGPVDLVGHDWGAILSLRLVSVRADLVRTWVLDNAGVAHADFQWHALAELWQTPGQGEAFMEAQMASDLEERAATLEAAGVPSGHAREMAADFDQEMGQSILALYRSATDVGREWSEDFVDIPAPGLVLSATADPYGSEERNLRGAEKAGADSRVLEGRGHWWMLEAPDEGARVIEEFWAAQR